MLEGLLAKKIGMTRIFTEDGRWIPVTVVQAGPCTVVQRKTTDKDGYEAVQLGFGDIKESKVNKPIGGHFKKVSVAPKRVLREFRVTEDSPLKPGDEIRTDIFTVGDRVDVTGITKGKGYQGVQKRHGFGGGPAAHGSMFHRRSGSIGQSADPSKVFKGLGMPGHMGHVRRTTQCIEVVGVDTEKNVLLLRGAVPGANGGILIVRRSVKTAKGA